MVTRAPTDPRLMDLSYISHQSYVLEIGEQYDMDTAEIGGT